MCNTRRHPVLTIARGFAAAAIFLASSFTDAEAQQSRVEGRERAVFVTGSTSGIGLRMTEVLSSNGFHVYAGARTHWQITDRLGVYAQLRRTA